MTGLPEKRELEAGPVSSLPGDSARFLADEGVIGIVLLDESLIVRDRYGPLADIVPLGTELCEDVASFVGLGPDLLALQDDPTASFSLPNVGLIHRGAPIKLSIEAFWEERKRRYHLVLHRLGLKSPSELELVRQQRARRIAEDHLRLAKARIIEHQALINLVIDHAPAAIAMFDPQMRCLFATRRWIETFGGELVPLAGHFDATALGGGDAGRGAERIARCLSGETVATEIEPGTGPAGAAHWVRWCHSPWRKADGSIGGIISFAEVLTEIVAGRQLLERNNAELSRINHQLDQFSSIISHDLKAPIRAIRYGTDALKASPADGAADQIESIERNVSRMARMLDDLLEYSRIGRAGDGEEPVDLAALIGEIKQSIPECAHFTISLDLECPMIATAVAPLDLVLRNLIENAVRHHDHATGGSLRLTMTSSADKWWFAVTDDGPGIAARFHGSIFDPFVQIDPRPGRANGGMGLALVAKVVSLYGGRIEVLSDPQVERGTTMRFTWPKQLMAR